MGQKVNPISMRLGINRTWDSRWYAGKNEYSILLKEDLNMRKMIMKDLKNAAISKVVIERPHKKCLVTIYSGRPGLIIGKKGSSIKNLGISSREQLEGFFNIKVFLDLTVKVKRWRSSIEFLKNNLFS